MLIGHIFVELTWADGGVDGNSPNADLTWRLFCGLGATERIPSKCHDLGQSREILCWHNLGTRFARDPRLVFIQWFTLLSLPLEQWKKNPIPSLYRPMVRDLSDKSIFLEITSSSV